ncbi:arsenite-resistance protein 2 domain containing protein [Babesia gibsoni]|uniref:Arsenite-resistance protein 2 domain containing protein n=1 Tax=Babesia gibsoni TaxID=33632 RepID=A0AAD8PC66_BABGI|nr:arsenite-resistance protein 2 domain containing protein [Babesia gibsoni]
MERMGKMIRPMPPRRRPRISGVDPHRMLNFKQFILLKEDGISPEKAAEEYTKYFHDFLASEINRYYDAYVHLAFFREKFHPYFLHIEHEITKEEIRQNSKDFVMKFTNGNFDELLLEISFKRLYGTLTSHDDTSTAEEAYKYNEWAYEIPVEYPKDDKHTSRLPIDSPLKSVLLVDVPDKVYKHEIYSVLKDHLSRFSIYMAERDMVRTAFVNVPDDDLKKVCDTLCAHRLTVQEFLLRFEPCNPLQERIRIRVCPPVCSHPVILSRDLDLTARLIRKLDGDFCPSEKSFVDYLPENLDLRKRLDLQITYLRRVHSYCYYGRIKGNCYIDLWDLCGPGHVRVDLNNDLYEREEGLTANKVAVKFAFWEGDKNEQASSEAGVKDWEKELLGSCEVSKSQLQWLRDVESFAMHLLSCDMAPPEYSQDEDEVEEKWKQFCNINTIVDGPERFRCRLCHKLFNDSKFVWKHLKLKHGDNHKKIVIECGVPRMKEIFKNTHRSFRCNPFERLLTLPIVQLPPGDVDLPTLESNGHVKGRYNVRAEQGIKRRRREYFDFDRPQAKREQTVVIAQDDYTRPCVKYDDL